MKNVMLFWMTVCFIGCAVTPTLTKAPPTPVMLECAIVGADETATALVCSNESIDAFSKYLLASQDWEKDAWAKCGPKNGKK